MSGYVWSGENVTAPNGTTDSNNNGSEICRIFVDPDVEKRIVVDEMSLPDNTVKNDFDGDKYNIKNTAGVDYPLICINNIFLMNEEIEFMEIKMVDLIPTITLAISPKSNTLINREVIKDGDIISVFIRTTSDIITPIRSDFIINSCKIHGYEINGQGSEGSISLKGELFIPGIHSSRDNLFVIGNSKGALKEIAKKLGLGFAFNDDTETNDKQLWFSSKQKMTDFIKNITSHIWKDEQSFFKVWIDLYYNLNFINVNKCLISEDSIDMTIATMVNSMQNIAPDSSSEEDALGDIKMLSNYEARKMSPFYILDVTPKNNSSNVTSEVGSNIINQMFIHNQNYYNQGENPYIELSNVQMYDPNKRDKCVILRGRNQYNSNTALNEDMSYESVNTDEINTHTEWRGIQYTVSDSDGDNSSNEWSGNVNINYNRAETHNLINNKELDKMYIQVSLKGACLQIMRGEKIPVLVVYKDALDGIVVQENEKNTGVNKFYSGYFFVDEIKILYSYADKSSFENNFKTVLTLKRREWPVPVDYEKEENV